jgi:hypothetical protein
MSTDAMTHPEHGETVTAALGHINGWYAGDAGRMRRALHPALAKRIQTTDSSGELVVADIGACELIDRPGCPTR